MKDKELKKKFCEIGKIYGFNTAYGGCYKSSLECLTILELQKSNYGNYYYLNSRTYIQNILGQEFIPNKEIMRKTSIADVMYLIKDDSILDLDVQMEDNDRIEKMRILFETIIIPFTNSCLSKEGIVKLYHNENNIVIPPAVKKELGLT